MFLQVLREELDCQMPVEVIYNGPLEMTHEVLSRFEARPVPCPNVPQTHFGRSVLTFPELQLLRPCPHVKRHKAVQRADCVFDTCTVPLRPKMLLSDKQAGS